MSYGQSRCGAHEPPSNRRAPTRLPPNRQPTDDPTDVSTDVSTANWPHRRPQTPIPTTASRFLPPQSEAKRNKISKTGRASESAKRHCPAADAGWLSALRDSPADALRRKSKPVARRDKVGDEPNCVAARIVVACPPSVAPSFWGPHARFASTRSNASIEAAAIQILKEKNWESPPGGAIPKIT